MTSPVVRQIVKRGAPAGSGSTSTTTTPGRSTGFRAARAGHLAHPLRARRRLTAETPAMPDLAPVLVTASPQPPDPGPCGTRGHCWLPMSGQEPWREPRSAGRCARSAGRPVPTLSESCRSADPQAPPRPVCRQPTTPRPTASSDAGNHDVRRRTATQQPRSRSLRDSRARERRISWLARHRGAGSTGTRRSCPTGIAPRSTESEDLFRLDRRILDVREVLFKRGETREHL